MRASTIFTPASARCFGSCSSPTWLPFLYLTSTIQTGRCFSTTRQPQRNSPRASVAYERGSRSRLQKSLDRTEAVVPGEQREKPRRNTGQWAQEGSTDGASDAFGPLNDSLSNIGRSQLLEERTVRIRRVAPLTERDKAAPGPDWAQSEQTSGTTEYDDRRLNASSRASGYTRRESNSLSDSPSRRRHGSFDNVGRRSFDRGHDTTRSRLSGRGPSQTSRVPFDFGDGISPRLAPSLRLAKLKTESAPESTLTTKEYQAFQSLLALQDVASDSQSVGLREEEKKGLALNDALKASLGIEITPEAGRTPYGPAIDVSVNQRPEIRKVTSLMKDARTDSKLWSIIYDQVCQPVLESVRELGLLSTRRVQEQAAKQDPDAIARLSKSFPVHLLNYANLMREHFPSSLYNFHLLPWLKQSGEEIFTLGASTPLYNLHLHSLLTKHCDIPAMLEVLQDMHDRVYDHDGQTMQIISLALEQAQTVPAGSALAAIWQTEHMQDMHRQLQVWRARIEDQLNEKAFRKAREQEELAMREDQPDEQELQVQSSV